MPFRVLVTDYAWPTLEIERAILAEVGAELVVAPGEPLAGNRSQNLRNHVRPSEGKWLPVQSAGAVTCSLARDWRRLPT